jgi:RND family efflux transporter MFP subunit
MLSGCNGDGKKSLADTAAAVPVATSGVTQNHNGGFLSVSGKIQAANSAELGTRMMGHVSKIYATVGDKVKKGQLLVSINNADLQAKLAQVNAGITEAKAAYANAEKDYGRFKNLFDENSASQKEMDDMATRFEMAKARLEAANQMKNEINAQFAYTNITAPFGGVITGKFSEVGDMAHPGMSLLALEAPGDFEVIAMVPESEIAKISSDTTVDVLIKSVGASVKGRLKEVSTSAKNTGGQYLVKASLDQTDAKLFSGMFATVQIPVAHQSDTLAAVRIPQSAIITSGGLKGVYTISDQNRALLRWLRLGKVYGDQIEVLSGLDAGEQYIISSEGKLYNGAKVTIQ